MKAWLITWNWAGDHAAVDDPIVAVLSSRLGSEEVRKYVERCYIEHTASLDEKVAYARYNRQEPPPYPAEFAHVCPRGPSQWQVTSLLSHRQRLPSRSIWSWSP